MARGRWWRRVSILRIRLSCRLFYKLVLQSIEGTAWYVLITTSAVLILLASPCWSESVVVPLAPSHVTLKGAPAVISNSVFVKWREVDEGFVPAASILNLAVAVCPDVSSSWRMYEPAGVNAYGLHDRN